MSTNPNDDDRVGNLLRAFYLEFGEPDEGPPEGVNLSVLLGSSVPPESDLALLRLALADEAMKRKFRACSEHLAAVGGLLTGKDLLEEFSTHATVPEDQFDQLASGVFWFSLAATLDKRDGRGLPQLPVPGLDLPLPIRVRMTVHGSLVLQLYVALVYTREGAFRLVVETAAKARCPGAGRILKLLNCDYVRHVRNALSHGSFTPTITGICFRDEDHITVASPRFLGKLATFVSMCQLQVLAVSSQGGMTSSSRYIV